MKTLDYLTRLRLSFLDCVWMSSFVALVMQGRFIFAFTVCILGAFISVMAQKINRNNQLAEYAIAQAKRDRQWQELADRHMKIEAIKKHREIYGSDLVTAKDAVDKYYMHR